MPWGVAAAAVAAGGAYMSSKEASKGAGGGGGAPSTQNFLMLGNPYYDPETGQYSTTQFHEGPIAQGTYDAQRNRLISGYTGEQQAQANAWNSVFAQEAAGGSAIERGLADHMSTTGGWGAVDAATGLQGQRTLNPYYMERNERMQGNALASAWQSSRGQAALGDQQAGYGRQLSDRGMGFLDTNYQDVAANRLSMLREQAAPQEERAQNAMAQKLFSMGQLGSEGGARNIEAFAQGQSNADLERQLQAQNMAVGLRQQDRAFAGQLMGAGDTMARTAGGLYSSGGRAVDQYSNLAQTMYGNRMQDNQYRYGRAQSRLADMQGLFGFGQGIKDTNMQRATLAQQNLQGVHGEMRENLALAANIANAGSGGNISGNSGGGGSAIGSALSGFGDSMANNPDAWSNAGSTISGWFGGGGGGGGSSASTGDVGSSSAWGDIFDFG